jgi:hypothetical protein
MCDDSADTSAVDSPAGPTFGFSQSRAYVIGINDYSNGIPPLRTAVADAERLGRRLESDGYVVRSYPRDGAAALGKLRELLGQTLPGEVGGDDRVLLYFAGHGIALDGEGGPEGFLVPQDARREDRTSFLPMTELHASLIDLPCRHLLLILDCCFAGAFRWSSTRDIGELPSILHCERFERYVRDPAWQVITSAAYDQRALDVLSGAPIGERLEDGDHSPFAAALFRGLDGEADLIPREQDGRPAGDGVITASELYLYLRECVETASASRRTRQTPGLWPLNKHDKGEYIFLTRGLPLDLPKAPLLDERHNPYLGLRAYEEYQSPLFFGRDRLVDELQRAVRSRPLTIVLGASGTGKSSLVKAGLLPRLRESAGEEWILLEQPRSAAPEGEPSTPAAIRPGPAPLTSLASVEPPPNAGPPDLTRRSAAFRADPRAFAAELRRLADARPGARLLLVIDQLEELVTLCRDGRERDLFMAHLARALVELVDRFRLVITLRSDFEPLFQESALGTGSDPAGRRDDGRGPVTRSDPWLAARFVVPPMTQDELREAIERPASAKVLYFEEGLVDSLINEVVQTPGALPLLSFTLSELYRNYLLRNPADRCLTMSDYGQLGGVAGSLRRRATEIYDQLGKRGAPPHGR